MLNAVLSAQNVDRENSNKIKQEEGALSVARVKAQALNVSLTCALHRDVKLTISLLRPKQTRKPTVSSPQRAPKPNVSASKPTPKHEPPRSPPKPRQRPYALRRRRTRRCSTSSRVRWSCAGWTSRAYRRSGRRPCLCPLRASVRRWAT